MSQSGIAAVLYAAKSSEDPRGSIPTQLADCRSAAEREHREVVAEFADEARSAFKGNRGPGLEDAKTAAMAAAQRHGQAELWVQHSDRLARGDGLVADHLGEIYFAMRRHGVRLRSVQDDANLEDVLRAVLIGERNYEDSARKAAATKAGKRRAAERGEPQFGIVPDGYLVLREVDAHGRVTRRMVADPERAPVIRLMFELAAQGWVDRAIVLELERRRHLTAPRKRGARPRPFDANRVRQTLTNPTYAGLMIQRGEIIGQGQWPAFVSESDFRALQDLRRARGSADRDPAGRPPEGYVLARVACCGICGARMDVVTSRYVRKDGSRGRRYVCRTHRERPHACAVLPFDAEILDRAFVANLTGFLGNVNAWRGRLVQSRESERARLGGEVARAKKDLSLHAATAEKLRARYEQALREDDNASAEELLAMLRNNRADRDRAERRLQAADDALSGELTDGDDVDGLLDFYNGLSAELAGRVEGTKGDVKHLNAVVREFFAAVILTARDTGTLMVPVLSEAAAERLLTNLRYWPHRLTAYARGSAPHTILSDSDKGLVLRATRDRAEFFWKGAQGQACHVDIQPGGEGCLPAPNSPRALVATGEEAIRPPLRAITAPSGIAQPPS